MILADASVRRPVAMGCLIIALALLGLDAWRTMNLELMPDLDLPFVTVVTVYPGAGPREIETDVAQDIEDALAGIDGIKHVSSICMENACQTLIEFELGVDVDIAATDVRERIDLVRGDFPAAVEDPQILKFDIGAVPIVTMALTGDATPEALYDYADNELSDRLSVLPGVAELQLVGGAPREVRVHLDRDALAVRGLTTLDVVGALSGNLGTVPAGRLRDAGEEIAVKFDAEEPSLEALARLEVAGADGARCRLDDLGTVTLDTPEVRQLAFVDGEPAVALRVIKKGDANAVAVTRTVREAVERLRPTLPGGMRLKWITDDGRFIEATNASAWWNVAEGIGLTAAILFLFLYNLRSLLVVGLTMPLTIVIGLFGMSLFGYSLNTSTLIAIGMSVGILVTNAIVVLEAIVGRLEDGVAPREAARLGAREAWIAVLASAGTNVVVLFPLAVMPSLIGLWIKPLAITMFIMTVVSLFVSFTLTPMLCALFLRARRADDRGPIAWLERRWNAGQDRVIALYRGAIERCERHRSLAVLVLALVVVLCVGLVTLGRDMGSGFVNEPDKGEVMVKVEYPTRYALAKTRERVAAIEARLADLPELRAMLTTVGKVDAILGQNAEGPHLAQILLRFSDRDERDLSINDLVAATRRRLADLPGAIVTVSQSTMVGGQGAAIELEISGPDLARLDAAGLAVRDLAAEIPGIEDADTTVRAGKAEVRVRPRRDVLADVGLPALSLGAMLRGRLEGLEAGTYKEGVRTFDVVVDFAEEEGRDQLAAFQVPAGEGAAVGLDAVGELDEGRAPVQITRVDKRRVAKVTTNLAPELPLGSGAAAIAAAMDREQVLGPGYGHRFAGQYEYMAEAQAAMGNAGILAVVLMVLTLAAILESFRQPLLILVTLPLALVGVVAALGLTGGNLGIFEIMGMVMLIGIVVNNGILIVDQFKVHVAEGIPRHKAMATAAAERFRPIVMITLAAVLGMLPLALGRGIGAELRNGVGIASVGGILVSGLLTMIVVPVLYNLFTRRQGGQEEP